MYEKSYKEQYYEQLLYATYRRWWTVKSGDVGYMKN